jgi:hypothetical protein
MKSRFARSRACQVDRRAANGANGGGEPSRDEDPQRLVAAFAPNSESLWLYLSGERNRECRFAGG